MENQKENLLLRKRKRRVVKAQSSTVQTRCLDTAKIKPDNSVLAMKLRMRYILSPHNLREPLEVIEKDLKEHNEGILTR